jgi:hypothetical protein
MLDSIRRRVRARRGAFAAQFQRIADNAIGLPARHAIAGAKAVSNRCAGRVEGEKPGSEAEPFGLLHSAYAVACTNGNDKLFKLPLCLMVHLQLVDSFEDFLEGG